MNGQWLVQVGKDKGSYKTRYSFSATEKHRAIFFYDCINAHSGYKKRLIDPNGNVLYRVITQREW